MARVFQQLSAPPADLELCYGQVTLCFDKVVPGDAALGFVPYYHFRILLADSRDAGRINFRVGDTDHITLVAGHIGYEISEAFRGHSYALQACRALAPFVRLFYPAVIITSNPDNLPSVRTIEKLGATFLDDAGAERAIVMGSYGIGPARIAAATIEQGADERGIVWPASIAPWQVHLVSLARAGEDERTAADNLYEELTGAGVEVLYDERDAGTGQKLTDAELLGCPLRIVVGRRGLAEGVVEASERGSGTEHKLPVGEAGAQAQALLQRGDG